jgi:alpha-galactosidase
MGFRLLRLAVLLTIPLSAGRADVVRLDELPLDMIQQDWGDPHANRSVDANELSIGGQRFKHGIGGHLEFSWNLELDGKAERLTASVGIDDEVKRDPQAKELGVEFKVLGDRGSVLWRSGKVRSGEAAKRVDVNLHGQHKLTLIAVSVDSGINYGHVDWADATIAFAGARPRPIEPAREPREILTPPAPPTPRINGATVFGVRPTNSILFTIAATGERPMTFAADGLPEGVKLDAATGRLSGSVAKAGTYELMLRATNARGTAERKFKLVVGDKLSLTPPMGWNSWNSFAGTVSDAKVRAAADAFITAGLADHGYTYINIDDCWQLDAQKFPREKRRDASGRVLTNEKFPDMAALADYVHSKGLKIGIYSSPGETTCANFEGSLGHELDDAKQYAAWGYDYLKYDWCSYGRVFDEKVRADKNRSRVELRQEPYVLMGKALQEQPRDIVYSLCQYGDEKVWEWGEKLGGQLWRTTGDITDTWRSVSRIGFEQNGLESHAGPGHWNDPDMLAVGKVGWGDKLRDTKLTPNEQYSHITLWSLLNAPLLIGCDLTQLDPFTLGLLTNDEVIAVNQDARGEQARRVAQDKERETEVWAKRLEDGSLAIGLFNRGEEAQTVRVTFAQLGLTGPQQIRDLWRQQDVQSDADGYAVEIGRHGAAMLRVSPKR